MSRSAATLRIALVHDYLAEYGGAERVVEALHDLYPQAPLYTAFVDWARLGSHAANFRQWDIRTTWLNNFPFIRQLFSPLRFLAPSAFRQLDLTAYDLVISSTNAYFAKAVQVRPGATHICYCHTPSRSLWGYTTQTDWQRHRVTRFFGTLINHYLRVEDVRVARQNVDIFVANSHETAQRIRKFYKREAVVIAPPVQVPDKPPVKPASWQQSYFLFVNRLALAKHPELAIQACNQLELPLKVVGDGKLLAKLRQLAGPTIEFLGHVPDNQLSKLYQNARALIYPAEDEDFGIVPVEAMAYGTPVIAHRSGGPLETIIAGKTGEFFDQLTVDSLVATLQDFVPAKFLPNRLHQQALKFSTKKFQDRMAQRVRQATATV